MIALLFVPELICGALVRLPSGIGKSGGPFHWLRRLPIYRHIAALAAALNILLMMIANLIGYSVGVSGTLGAVWRVFYNPDNGAFMLFATLLTFFCAAQLMFRIEEWREGRDAAKDGSARPHTDTDHAA
jgi:hypothetical protein